MISYINIAHLFSMKPVVCIFDKVFYLLIEFFSCVHVFLSLSPQPCLLVLEVFKLSLDIPLEVEHFDFIKCLIIRSQEFILPPWHPILLKSSKRISNPLIFVNLISCKDVLCEIPNPLFIHSMIYCRSVVGIWGLCELSVSFYTIPFELLIIVIKNSVIVFSTCSSFFRNERLKSLKIIDCVVNLISVILIEELRLICNFITESSERST